MHFISMRGAPTPDREMKAKALVDHQILYRTQPLPASPEKLYQLFVNGGRIAARVDKRSVTSSLLRAEHISLSNSACYENPRSKGGRASYAQDKFFEWANYVPAQDEIRIGVMGDTFNCPAGISIWKSFTPLSKLNEFEKNDDAVLGNVIPNETAFEQRAGFNKNLGYQMLQCAFDDGIKEGYWDRDFNLKSAPKNRIVALGEPGGKVRALAIEVWMVTIVLSVLGHVLVETLRSLPEASAGLGYGEPAWRLLQEIRRKSLRAGANGIFLEYAWMKSSDLDKATDHCDRERCSYLLRGYLKGLGKDFENPFLLFSVRLLTSARECIWKADC